MAVTQDLLLEEISVNNDRNSSTVRIEWYSQQAGESNNDTKTAFYYVSINGGAEVAYEVSYTLPQYSTVTIVNKTIEVPHRNDGTGSITVRTKMNTGISSGIVTLTKSLNLTTIPRVTSLDVISCSTAYFSGEFTIKYTPKNSGSYTKCYISLDEGAVPTDVKEIALGKNAESQQTTTFKFLGSERSKIYKKLPDTTKGILRFVLSTYSDEEYSNWIGDSEIKWIALSIPKSEGIVPTASMTLTPVSTLVSPFDVLYIKGKSKVRVDLEEIEGKFGAWIVSCEVSVGGKSGNPPYTSEYLLNSGYVTVLGTLTDSRGFSTAFKEFITVIDYAPPQILPASDESEVIAARCDSSGNLNDLGTFLKIKAKRYYSKVISGGVLQPAVQNNFCALQYRYKENGGDYSSWTTILDTTSSSDEVETEALEGTLDVTKSYYVQVRAIDDVGEVALSTVVIPTEKVYMHKAGSINAFALGKYAEEENTFDVAEDLTAIFRGDVRFEGEAWVPLPLGTNVAESSVNSGRWGGSGVYYRVCAGGKHIYVAFNISFATSNSTVRAESYTIPYPPNYDVYALCPVGFADGSRGIATVSISPKGEVNIYAVHKLPGATLSTEETVYWIDGYIDYWI